jgi:hypothetical protein
MQVLVAQRTAADTGSTMAEIHDTQRPLATSAPNLWDRIPRQTRVTGTCQPAATGWAWIIRPAGRCCRCVMASPGRQTLRCRAGR